MIRRALQYTWFNEQNCIIHPDLQELEFYLKNHCEHSLALILKKRLEVGNFDTKTIINCWIFIRIHLLRSLQNWFSYLFTHNWKSFEKNNIVLCISFNCNISANEEPTEPLNIPEFRKTWIEIILIPEPYVVQTDYINKLKSG
jgi:hypothetical protein